MKCYNKANSIFQYEQSGDLTKVKAEQAHARRVSSQLRTLLRDLELLRAQVQDSDLIAFDKLTQRSRDQTLKAIMDYLGLYVIYDAYIQCVNKLTHN